MRFVVDKIYVKLLKKVSATDKVRKETLSKRNDAAYNNRKAWKELEAAKDTRVVAASRYADVLSSAKEEDEDVKVAFDTFEVFYAEKKAEIAELESEYTSTKIRISALKAKLKKAYIQNRYGLKDECLNKLGENKKKLLSLSSRIGAIRKQISIEKARVEAEVLGNNLEFREARVELDEAKLEESRRTRIHNELFGIQKDAVAAYDRACKEHNAAVTELWYYMIGKKMRLAAATGAAM